MESSSTRRLKEVVRLAVERLAYHRFYPEIVLEKLYREAYVDGFGDGILAVEEEKERNA